MVSIKNKIRLVFNLLLMKNLILTLVIIVIAVPMMGQTKSEKKKIKKEQNLKDYAATKELIDSGNFQFIAEWARTQKGRRINLISNPNYLKINTMEADIHLPYYGVVHTPSAGFSSEGGIVVKDVVKNFKIDVKDKKQKITVRFDGKGKNDQYEFILFIYQNKSATLSVNSNSRSSINYDGKITPLENDSKPK